MRWQTTAALAVVLAILGAFFYVSEVRLAPEREKAESGKRRVFTVEPSEITGLTIERPNEKIQVTRTSDGWDLQAPVKARGDRATIDDVLTNVLTAKSDREIEASPAPSALADFGLDKPAARITMMRRDGSSLGLTLGGKNPTGAWVYARPADRPAVLALGESVLRDATRPVLDFRDKTVLAFDRGAVTGIEVATRDETLVFATADNRWTLTKPRALPADADVVRDFLDKLSGAKAKEFVAESPDSLARWGLDQPTRVTVVTGKDKDRAGRTLAFGRVDADKKGVYAMRQGDTAVMLVPEEVWTAVPKTVATARDKTVVPFEHDKVAKIELSSARGAVTLVRADHRWSIAAPEALPADQTEAGGVLFKLRDLKAQAFLTEDASGIARYLAKPEVKVTVTENGQTKTILLASSSEKRAGQPSAYAGVADRGPVVLVDAKVLADLSKSVTDLRDRALLSGLEPKDVKRMTVKAGGASMLLEKRGDSWTVLEPARGGAKDTKVDDLLFTLRGLRWKEIAAPAGAEPAKFGFDAPAFEVGLFRPDGTEIATVIVGKRDAETAYVKTRSAPAVYAVDAKLLGELPKVPDDLRG
jgi:hypothetical protein